MERQLRKGFQDPRPDHAPETESSRLWIVPLFLFGQTLLCGFLGYPKAMLLMVFITSLLTSFVIVIYIDELTETPRVY